MDFKSEMKDIVSMQNLGLSVIPEVRALSHCYY